MKIKKYVITMKDRYLTENEAKALIEMFNQIDQTKDKLKLKKISTEAYLIRIPKTEELATHIPKIKEIVEFCEAKIYTTTDTFADLERRYKASQKVATA